MLKEPAEENDFRATHFLRIYYRYLLKYLLNIVLTEVFIEAPAKVFT